VTGGVYARADAALADADAHGRLRVGGVDVAPHRGAKRDLAPASCRWCDRDAAGNDTLNPIDAAARDALRWQSPHVAARISDAIGFLGVPATSLATLRAAAADEGSGWKTTGVDVLLVGEAAMLSGVLNQAVKLGVGRERPFVHALREEEKAKTPHPTDNNLSFYSGHTSLTFSVATASGTIASLRGYRLAPLVWASTTTLAATTGYLRIAADKHYLTDVLTGAFLGAAMGVLVPLVFHPRRNETTAPQPAGAGPLPAMATLGGVTLF
jgi:membrane-associated phospholipid phosphatase